MLRPSLSLILILNASSSFLSGLLLVLAPTFVADLIGTVPAWLCQWVGVGLLLFSLGVAWTAWRLPQRWRLTRWIFALDILWLLATPLVMLMFAAYLNLLGQLLLLLVAAVVMWFAFWEVYWVRRGPTA